MKTEFLISWRYLLTRRKEKFISLISVISILGIAIGVAALIIVIGVMTGFDRDLRDKIVGNYSHITIGGYHPIDQASYDVILKNAAPNPHVTGISPYIQGQVLVKDGKRFFAVGLRGIDPRTEPQVTKLKDYLTSGSIDALNKSTIIIGKELAAYLGAGTGSSVIIHSPTGKEYDLKVAAIFNSGMYDYDLNLVFLSLDGARQVLEVPEGQVSAVAVKLDDLYLAENVRKELSAALGPDYYLKTWMDQNRNFFAALKLEKFAMFVILFLIILVASFNIISTLVVTVTEKTKDIGIFKALGMSSSSIRKVFTYLGLCIGVLGVVLGTGIGVLLCMLLKKYKFITLPPDIYYVTTLPVVIEWPDIVLIVAGAMAIVFVSTLYPAFKAARLRPVDALRYE